MNTQHPSKVIQKDKFFSISEVEVGEKNGKKIFHKVVTGNPTASVFPISDRGEIYLIDQYRYLFGKRVLGAISGNLDKDESAATAARREMKEETGMEARQLELLTIVELSRSVMRRKAYLYVAKDLIFGTASPEEDEDIELVKMPLQDAVKKIFSGEINHAASIIGILMLDKLKQQRKL